jgi:methylated-DNA-[protein]-cysteine S-methyltransferase
MVHCRQAYWKNDLGNWGLVAEGEELIALYPPLHRKLKNWMPPSNIVDSVFLAVIDQLERYFAGEQFLFDVPHRLKGTPFQISVWRQLLTIPYGQTTTYGELAIQLGNPKACRAIGNANSLNPISIIYPCHRVVGAKGHLTGYAGGLDCKNQLLMLERSAARASC